MPAGITFVGSRGGIAGGFSRLSDALIEAARPRIQKAAELTADQAVTNILANIASTFGERKGKSRSEPLADSARYVSEVNVTTKGSVIRFHVDGSKAFKDKWAALNYGSGEHEIAPSGVALANPLDTSRSPKGFFSKTAVTHPGNKRTMFYEDGIDAALRDFRSNL